MKKRKLSVLILTTLLLIMIPVTDVRAEEVSRRDTTASVEFRRGENSILTIDSAPSEFNFGTPEIKYRENNTFTHNRPVEEIIINDFRGTGGGWALTAQLSEFTMEENITLKGAEVILTNGKVESTHEPAYKPVVTNNLDGEIVLQANEPTRIVTSNIGQGMGITPVKWVEDSVRLYVPHETMLEGIHAASIQWTLHDTP